MWDLVDVLETECDAVIGVTSQLDEEGFATPTACEPWDIKALLAHMWRTLLRILTALEQPEPPTADVDAVGYWTSYDPKGDAPRIATHAMEISAGYDLGAELVTSFQELVVECVNLASQWGPDRRIELWWGPRMQLDEFLKTRIVDIVVHGIDLTDALEQPPITTSRGLVVTTAILDALLGESPPTELAWSDLDLIRKGTGRTPLTDGEVTILGPLAERFPLLA